MSDEFHIIHVGRLFDGRDVIFKYDPCQPSTMRVGLLIVLVSYKHTSLIRLLVLFHTVIE